jgi:thermitase
MGRNRSRTADIRVILVLLGALFWAPAAGAVPPEHATAGRRTWVTDELLVAHRAGVSSSRAESIYRSHGARIVDEISQIRVHVLRVPPSALRSVKRSLSRHSDVEFVERNYILPPVRSPNDPYYPVQWHLPRISAPSAWDVSVGDPGVIVAILDSGVDPSHPDLAANLVPGYNFYDDNTDTADVYGHGTQVAGSAVAIGDNATGVASVAWRSSLMPVRVTDTQGLAYTSTIARGLTWAVDNGARIMNISFSNVAGSSTIRTAAQYVMEKGGLVVAAAGNCGCADPTANNPYIISVSAITPKDGLAAFSSTGSYVDVTAPGVTIVTTERGGAYTTVSGTSFSSPITAGVLALMMSANPALGPAELESLLEATADDLGPAGYDTSFGFGLVDAAAAVNAAAGTSAPPPDTSAPSVSISSPADGGVVSGVTVVDVAAVDDRAVSRVEIHVDGVPLATDTAAPFSFAWDTSAVAAGVHDLQAMAFDAAGNAGTSALVRVTVDGGDTTPPAVSIISPLNGSTAPRSTKIVLSATDDREVKTLEAFVDGVVLGSTACSARSCSATFMWRTQRATAGPHVVSGVAYDAAGNAQNPTPVTVYVQ